MSKLALYLIIVGIAAVGAGGQYLLKSSLDAQQVSHWSAASFIRMLPRLLASPAILVALILYAAAIMAYLFLLSRFEITRLFPMIVAINFALVALVSWRLLGEAATLTRALGMATIVLGVVLIVRS